MTKHLNLRRLLCFALGALSLLLLAMTPTRVAPACETFYSIDAKESAESLPEEAKLHLSATKTDAGVHLQATAEDPHLFYVLPDSSDRVSVTLAKPVATTPVLHLAVDGKWQEASILSPATQTEDEATVTYTFYPPAGNSATFYALRMGEDFTLVSLRHDAVGEGTFYRFNTTAFILFILVVGALLLFERKLHFFAELKAFFRRQAALALSFRGGKRVLHFACMAILAAFALLAFADLALSLTLPIFATLLWCLALLSVVALLIEGLWLRSDISFAKLFFLVFAVLGTAFALSLPPTLLVSWDDEFHFAHMATPAAFLTGGEIPASAQNVIEARPHYGNFFLDSEGFASALLSLDGVGLSIPSWGLLSVHPLLLILAIPVILLYGIFRYLVYLPGILVCTLGFLLNADIIFIMTLCRLAMLLLCATVFALGIRRLVYGKHLFAVCALLPSTLFLSVNFSCDVFITSFIALAAAYFIGELQRPNEPLTLKNAIIMISALAIGCGPKAIYFALFIPLLFMPKAKFTSPRTARIFRLCILGVMFFIFLTIIAPFFLGGAGYSDIRGGSDVNATEQIKYILTTPFVYLRDLFRFLAGYVGLPSATAHVIFYAYLPSGSAFLGSAYILLALCVAMADRRRDEAWDLSVRPFPKAISLLTVFATICLIATSLYVGFTPVGASTINGCQFRYLFPLIPIALYFLTSVRMCSFISEKRLTLLTLGVGALINLILIFESLIRHSPFI